MRHTVMLSVLSVCVLVACGTPAQPAAPLPTPTLVQPISYGYPMPTRPTQRMLADGRWVPYPAAEQAAVQATAEPPPPTPTATVIPLITPTPGGTLLRDLWRAPADRAPVRFLYYSSAEIVGDQYTYAFWRVEVRQPRQRQRLFTIPDVHTANYPVFGTLAPDGQHIAYLRELGTGAELRLVRSDGREDRLLLRPVGATVTRGRHRFAWSPDSRHLAFIKAWEQGQGFYVYDVASGAPPREVARVGGAALAGWQDSQHMLIYLVTDRQQPLQLTAIDITTGQQQALAHLPFDGTVLSTLPAPDHSRLYISGYSYDLATTQFTKLPTLEESIAWGPDSQTLLELPDPTYGGGTRLLPINPAQPPIGLRLLPPYRATDYLSLEHLAPDGRYLVLVQNHGEGQVDHLLYDVAQDRWSTLTTGNTGLSVLGWQ